VQHVASPSNASATESESMEGWASMLERVGERAAQEDKPEDDNDGQRSMPQPLVQVFPAIHSHSSRFSIHTSILENLRGSIAGASVSRVVGVPTHFSCL
jgi:hypothetical protein